MVCGWVGYRGVNSRTPFLSCTKLTGYGVPHSSCTVSLLFALHVWRCCCNDIFLSPGPGEFLLSFFGNPEPSTLVPGWSIFYPMPNDVISSQVRRVQHVSCPLFCPSSWATSPNVTCFGSSPGSVRATKRVKSFHHRRLAVSALGASAGHWVR